LYSLRIPLQKWRGILVNGRNGREGRKGRKGRKARGNFER
tara:strand:+ start:295 stop:414 length:120 start_codon:yes stop_codon:yes gene_type:complete